MQSIVDRHSGCSFLYGVDFNVSKNTDSVCCQYVDNFCSDNKITWLDTGDGATNYTYHNDANCHYS